jgi:hypothetical protein
MKESGSKNFFFEKKKQKTFAPLRAVLQTPMPVGRNSAAYSADRRRQPMAEYAALFRPTGDRVSNAHAPWMKVFCGAFLQKSDRLLGRGA